MAETTAEILIYKRSTDPYARVPKALLNDERLSWKAKGIASYLLGKPVDWRTRVADLVNRGTDGRDAVYAGMKELRAAGYMGKRVHRGEGGKIERVDYLLADSPAFENDQPLTGKPEVARQPLTGIPEPGQPDTANPPLTKKDELQRKNHQEGSGPGYDVPEEETLPPGMGMDALRLLLLPLFNLPLHHHPTRLELDGLLAADGKFEEWQIGALVRFYKLPADSKVPGTKTRKQTLRTLLDSMGEQVGLATKAFPPPRFAQRPAAAPDGVKPPEASPGRSPEQLQAAHEAAYRGKVRAGLVPSVPTDRADDPTLEIPPRPTFPPKL